ncbi:TetR family transcriptional regulator [Saccharothrix sp. Mg75]|uniref:TetR family transcriptional regulator n=1 Tax=Saccharothrix sp. Mg75 TaxID=3445357 RepID=UPI003EEEC765
MSDRAQGSRTRAALVAAGIELFDRDGYDATSLDAVCRRVSVTKGALYRHYPSKQALAVAVVEEYFRRWHEVREAIERRGTGPLATLVELTDGMNGLARTDRVVRVGVRLLFTGELFDLLAGVHVACLAAVVRDLLGRAERAGELVPGLDLRDEADGITSAVIGTQALAAVATGRAGRPGALWRHRLARLATPSAAPSPVPSVDRAG